MEGVEQSIAGPSKPAVLPVIQEREEDSSSSDDSDDEDDIPIAHLRKNTFNG